MKQNPSPAKDHAAQTRGQYERDPKARTGHFTGAGDPSIKQQMKRKGSTRAKGELPGRNK